MWLGMADRQRPNNHLMNSSHAAAMAGDGILCPRCRGRGGTSSSSPGRVFFCLVPLEFGFAFITFVVPVTVRGAGPNLVGQPLYVGSRYSANAGPPCLDVHAGRSGAALPLVIADVGMLASSQPWPASRSWSRSGW